MELKPLAWYKLSDVFEKITSTEIHLSKGDKTTIYWGSKYVAIMTPMEKYLDYVRYEHELAHITFGTNPSYLQDLATRIGNELNMSPTMVYEYVSALECVRVQSLWSELYSGSHIVFTKNLRKGNAPLDITLGLAYKPENVPIELYDLKPIVDRIKYKSIWSLYDVAKTYVSMIKLLQQQTQGTGQNNQTQQRSNNTSSTSSQKSVNRHVMIGDVGYDKQKYEELEDIDDKDSENMAREQLEEVKEKVSMLTQEERDNKRLMFPVEERVSRSFNTFTDDPKLTGELTRLFNRFKGANYYVPSEQGTAIDVEGYIQRLSGTNAERWLDVKSRSRLTVIVLLDLSDSMNIVLSTLARVGLSLMKALKGVKAIRFKVYCYYGWGSVLHIKEVTENELKQINCNGTTPTAEALEYLDVRLNGTSDRKLLLIVTDGEPTDLKGQTYDKVIEITRYRINMLRQRGTQVFTIVLATQDKIQRVKQWVRRAFGPEGAYTITTPYSVGKIVVGMVTSHIIKALTY